METATDAVEVPSMKPDALTVVTLTVSDCAEVAFLAV